MADGVSSNPAQKSRKRVRKPEEWSRNKKKSLRNQGKEYFTSAKSGEQRKVEAKQIGEDCRCPLKCFQKVCEEGRSSIFSGFWELGDWNSQNAYLCACIKTQEVRRRYGKEEHSPRNFSRHYYVNCSGVSIRVCKKAFLSIHGVSNGRVSRAVVKFQEKGSPEMDRRGKQESVNKTPEENLRFVRSHIESFPAESSHYCRKDNPHRRYLSAELNIRKMHELYLEKCKADGKTPVKENIYRKIFNTEYNLSFGSPKTDTCNTCDELQNSIQAENDEQKLRQLKVQQELHHRKAKSGYDTLRADQELAKTNPDVSMITFDLQQVLPTPRLTTNVAFYKRQLSVYNLGIHEASTMKGYMHIWPESDGGQGSEEVASCLFKYVNEEKPENAKHIISFSDTCGGQNRNFNIASMWLYCVGVGKAQLIDHKFMYSGHSFLPNDREYGSIEQKKRQVGMVYVPEDWHSLIRSARRHNPFIVKEMTRSDFKSFSPVRAQLVNRKTNTDGDKVGWLKIHWMRFDADHPGKMLYKHSFSEIEPWKTANFKRQGRGRPGGISQVQLPLLYSETRLISRAKYDDLMSLLAYIPPVHHGFYQALKASSAVPHDGSDDVDDDDDEAEV